MRVLSRNKINNAIKQGVILSFIQGLITEDELRKVIYNPENREVFGNVLFSNRA